jgi:D-alanyl-D-alanine carboxypeptidase
MKFWLAALAIISAWSSSAFGDPVDDLAQKEMREHALPGFALEVIKNGQPIKITGYGMANLEWNNPVTPDTAFEIGSMTKQFTAAGILLLAQDGKLSVDDKLSAHMSNTPAIWKDITLRHLMTHTSGVRNYNRLAGFELTRHLTQAKFIEQLGVVPLDFEPGESWSYSNSGFSLLGYVIENVSGQNYWEFMRKRIFGPLKMDHTTSRDPSQIIPFRAKGYETDHSGHFINRDYDLTDIFAAGAIVSTIGDLAKWNASLDDNKLLTPATEKLMWTPVKLNSGKIHQYGFGWFLNPWHGHENIGHSGSTSGFSASLERFPQDGLAVIVLSNADESGVATKVAKAVADVYLAK